MLLVSRPCPELSVRRLRGLGLLTATAAIALSGCSADITRFDSPYFALSDGGPAGLRQGCAFERRPAGRRGAEAGTAAPYPTHHQRAAARNRASSYQRWFPDRAPPHDPLGTHLRASSRPRQLPRRPPRRGRSPEASHRGPARRHSLRSSRRHGVTISELMSVNELRNPTIRPGQKLQLPGQGRSRQVPPPAAPDHR